MTKVADAMREYNRRCEEAGDDVNLTKLAEEVAKDYKLHPVTFAHNVLRRK